VKEAAKKKEKKEEEAKKEEKKEPEPNFEMLENPARVMRQQVQKYLSVKLTRYLNFEFAQLKVLQMAEGCNYIPVKELSIGGIIMVRQAQPNTPEELVEPVAGLNFLLEIQCYRN
jgi:26S proteasome regulatory subunit N2